MFASRYTIISAEEQGVYEKFKDLAYVTCQWRLNRAPRLPILKCCIFARVSSRSLISTLPIGGCFEEDLPAGQPVWRAGIVEYKREWYIISGLLQSAQFSEPRRPVLISKNSDCQWCTTGSSACPSLIELGGSIRICFSRA